MGRDLDRLVEVGVSNLAFGFLAAWLLGPSAGRAPTRIEERTAWQAV